MAARGVLVDHATVHLGALKMLPLLPLLPLLAFVFRHRKLAVGSSWRVDETYVLVGGQRKYLYRAVDKLGLCLLEEPDDLFLGELALPHVRRSPGWRTPDTAGWYGWWGGGQFRSAVQIIAGIETRHLIKKGQHRRPDGLAFSAAECFYSLAAA